MKLNFRYLSFDGTVPASFRFTKISWRPVPHDETMLSLDDKTIRRPEFRDRSCIPGLSRRSRAYWLRLPPGRDQKAHVSMVSLASTSADAAERVFTPWRKGSVEMPIADTFWAVRFVMLTRSVRHPWIITASR